eukprot:468555-Pleurochrysis_carterae.AAC.6
MGLFVTSASGRGDCSRDKTIVRSFALKTILGYVLCSLLPERRSWLYKILGSSEMLPAHKLSPFKVIEAAKAQNIFVLRRRVENVQAGRVYLTSLFVGSTCAAAIPAPHSTTG